MGWVPRRKTSCQVMLDARDFPFTFQVEIGLFLWCVGCFGCVVIVGLGCVGCFWVVSLLVGLGCAVIVVVIG